MSDPLAAYLKYLTLERDASPHTLRSYRSDLREFQVFVGRDKPLGEVDGRTVRAYLAHLHTRGLDGASVARKLAALRSWFRFLVRRGKLARNVARDVRGPRLGRTLVSFLPIDEAQVLVDGKAVGVLTSGNFSPVLGHGIALGFVPPTLDVGTEVAIDVRGTALPGRIVATPFVAKK